MKALIYIKVTIWQRQTKKIYNIIY